MDIAIYSRISTDKQDNQNQLDQLRGFAASQGWHIKREYVDVATGKNSDREQFKALFKAASRREFELVRHVSRGRHLYPRRDREARAGQAQRTHDCWSATCESSGPDRWPTPSSVRPERGFAPQNGRQDSCRNCPQAETKQIDHLSGSSAKRAQLGRRFGSGLPLDRSRSYLHCPYMDSSSEDS